MQSIIRGLLYSPLFYFRLGAVLSFLLTAAPSDAISINFESVADNTGLGVTVTNQFSGQGVTFTNATALTAGLSLNEIDFPPHSGTTVVSNSGVAVMRLDFSAPLLDVGGFFTYSLTIPEQLILHAYDANGVLLGTASSAFSDNTADLFGQPGSSPNEFIHLAGIGAIRRLDIVAPAPDSFTLEDLVFTPGLAGGSVPEPVGLILLLIGLAILLCRSHFVNQNQTRSR